ncbi:MAG: hypothetical protein IJ272_05670 [Clostridia bacterium]|nr:hypothetical protein [Clostridia bacterium]
MKGYVILRDYAVQNNLSIPEVFELGREKGLLKTINKGSRANIYIKKNAFKKK